jgi:hypothetical protein
MTQVIHFLALCMAPLSLLAGLFALVAIDAANRRIEQLGEEVEDLDTVSTTQVRILAERVNKLEKNTGLLLDTQQTQGQLLEAILGPQIDPSNN